MTDAPHRNTNRKCICKCSECLEVSTSASYYENSPGFSVEMHSCIFSVPQITGHFSNALSEEFVFLCRNFCAFSLIIPCCVYLLEYFSKRMQLNSNVMKRATVKFICYVRKIFKCPRHLERASVKNLGKTVVQTSYYIFP